MEFHCDRNGQLKVTLSSDDKYCRVGDLKRDILEGLAHGGPLLAEDGSGFYLLHQGKLLDDDQLATLEFANGGAVISVIPRVLGGKGGFGSMLRAIGAQIEKTTNRDACRDLSGRRLRDINEEQRLKKWYAKQQEREQARKEAKKVKLAKLRQFADGPALPKIEDQAFLQKREDIEESVYEAVDQGFGSAQFKSETYGDSNDASNSSSSSDQASGDPSEKKKGTSEETPGQGGASSNDNDLVGTEGAVITLATTSTSKGEKKTMRKTMFDEDLDTDSSTDESEDESVPPSKKTKKN